MASDQAASKAGLMGLERNFQMSGALPAARPPPKDRHARRAVRHSGARRDPDNDPPGAASHLWVFLLWAAHRGFGRPSRVERSLLGDRRDWLCPDFYRLGCGLRNDPGHCALARRSGHAVALRELARRVAIAHRGVAHREIAHREIDCPALDSHGADSRAPEPREIDCHEIDTRGRHCLCGRRRDSPYRGVGSPDRLHPLDRPGPRRRHPRPHRYQSQTQRRRVR